MTEMEAIRARHSVRSYQDKKIDADTAAKLQAMIDACNKEGDLHLQFLSDAGNTFGRLLSRVMGLSSAPSVIACIGKDDDTLDERIGYWGEKIVLYAQQLGLNTCWAGTFQAKGVPAQPGPGERMPIVIAIGYGVNGGRVRKSKTPEQVVQGDLSAMPDWFRQGVEAALLAPTAINQQKFRIAL